MRKALLAIIFTGVPLFMAAQKSDAAIKAYINRYAAWAVETEKENHVPASITLAQGILESDAGRSGLARNANNHFGIKAYPGWTRPVYYAMDDEKQPSRFCHYSSVKESYIDHAAFLNKYTRYRSLFSLNPRDYRSWCWGLQKAGYATSKTYAVALIGLIESYGLYRYNGGTKLPPSAAEAEPIFITYQKHIPVKRMKRQVVVIDRMVEVEEEVEITEEDLLEKVMTVYDIHHRNGVSCTVLRLGEDLDMVARRENISKHDLKRLNELSEMDEADLDDYLGVGTIIYLDKKQSKYYENDVEFTISKRGDSLYSVSQRYGMKVKALAKINKDIFKRYGFYSVIPEDVKLWLK